MTHNTVMSPLKKQPIGSRMRRSASAFFKIRGGHTFLITCGICTIAVGAFLSLLSYLASLSASLSGSTLFSLFIVLSIGFLFLAIAGTVFVITRIAALRKIRGRKSLPLVMPKFPTILRITVLVILFLWAAAPFLFILWCFTL